MPPKKDKTKVKVSKKDKTENAKTKQGVKINIDIDQSKKTRGVAPKPPVVRRMLPAFSSAPQGASYLSSMLSPNRKLLLYFCPGQNRKHPDCSTHPPPNPTAPTRHTNSVHQISHRRCAKALV